MFRSTVHNLLYRHHWLTKPGLQKYSVSICGNRITGIFNQLVIVRDGFQSYWCIRDGDLAERFIDTVHDDEAVGNFIIDNTE